MSDPDLTSPNANASLAEDAELARAIAAGDVQSFGRWMTRAEPALRAQLRGFAAVVDTEAVLQEGLLRVWQVAPRFVADGRPEGLLRLAHRVVHNLAISELRKARPKERVAAELIEPGVDSPALPDPLLRQHITACFEQLPRQPRAALRARLEGRGEVADLALSTRLGMQLNTFLQNITRARKLIASCLSSRGVEITP